MPLCEAAGYERSDCRNGWRSGSRKQKSPAWWMFISLQIAGGGDDLQGIKKGLMESGPIGLLSTKTMANNHTNVAIARQVTKSARDSAT
ncbi:hypothetical protein ACNKHV_18150 [Shigella flexneri]